MASACPLLLRPTFIGRTYHDLQLNFEPALASCANRSEQNPLLLQFTRMVNTTMDDIAYMLFDPAQSGDDSLLYHVNSTDHFQMCIQPAYSSAGQASSCHEFYTFMMIATKDDVAWPLLIIFGYVFILLVSMLSSLFAQLFARLSQTVFSGSITKKLVKNRNLRSFLPVTHRHEQTQNLKKLDEKKQFLRTVDVIARECRSHATSFVIRTENERGHINRAYF